MKKQKITIKFPDADAARAAFTELANREPDSQLAITQDGNELVIQTLTKQEAVKLQAELRSQLS